LGAIHLVLAQGFQLGWHLTGGGPSVDFINKIMQDKSGNIIITGAFSGTVDFDPGPGVFNLSIDLQHTHSDAFVAKYTAAGTFLWAKKFAAAQNAPDHGLQLAIDDTNNIYMVGEYQGDIQFFPGGTWYNWGNAPGKPRLFMTKLDSTGNFKWGYGWQNTGLSAYMYIKPFYWDNTETFFIGSDGFLYLGGVFSGKMNFNPNSSISLYDSTISSGSRCPFFLKISSSGEVQKVKSLKSQNSNAIFNFNHFTMDSNGDLWIASKNDQGFFLFDTIYLNQNPPTAHEGTMIRMDTSFSYLWHYTLRSGNFKFLKFKNNQFYAMVNYVPSNSPIDFDPGPAIVTPPFFGGDDIALVKYGSNGNLISFFAFGGSGNDVANAIDFTNNSDIFILGDFQGTIDVDPGPGIVAHQKNGLGFDLFLSRYDSNGTYISSTSFGSLDEDTSLDILVLEDNEVILSGEYRASMDIDPGTNSLIVGNNGGQDMFLINYTSCSKTYTTYADTACGSFALPGLAL
jgi:hypothetical protein